MKKILLATCYLLIASCLQAQLNTPKNTFTQADTLRGSNNENRDWWDVLRYDIRIKPDFEKKEIKGVVDIKYNAIDKINFVDMIANGQIKVYDIDSVSYKDSATLDGRRIRSVSSGKMEISNKLMQIDLQEPMMIDLIVLTDTLITGNPFDKRTQQKKLIKTDGKHMNNI